MTTVPEPAESSAIPLEGRLGDPAVLPRLYSWLSRGDWSGLLLLKSGDIERRVYFLDGRVSTVGSTDPSESLSAFLIRDGLMTEEDRSRAAGQLRTPDRGWSFGRQLVRAGMLQEKDLQRVERRRVVQLAESALALRTGTYACEAGQLAGDAQPQQALEVPRLVAEGVLTLWDANSALEVLGGRSSVLDLVVERLADHEATGADEPYDYTLLLCNGRRTLDEVIAASPLPEAASLRFLAALRLLDIVCVRPAPAIAPADAVAPAAEAPMPPLRPEAVAATERVAEPEAPRVPAAAAAPPVGVGPTGPRPGAGADAGAEPSRAQPASSRPAVPESKSGQAGAPRPASRESRPTATPPPAAPQRRPAAAETRPATSGSRTGWVLLIVVVLIAASAFFLWVGWRTLLPPTPAPGDVPGSTGATGSLTPSSGVLPAEGDSPERGGVGAPDAPGAAQPIDATTPSPDTGGTPAEASPSGQLTGAGAPAANPDPAGTTEPSSPEKSPAGASAGAAP